MITVCIVEDNEQLRGTLARVINRAEGFRCLSHYATAEAALEALPKDRPDVVLMDINLPGMNGVECVRQLKLAAPQISVVMLTVYEDTENIFNALAAGASGYLLKRTKSAELLEAIREVHRGGSPMTTHIARKVTQSFQKAGPSIQPTENLSQRELGDCGGESNHVMADFRFDGMNALQAKASLGADGASCILGYKSGLG